MNAFDYDVFLSHSARDKPIVRKLAQRLKSDGLRVCLDEKGLEQSRTLVLVMSKNAFASDWVTLERHTLLFRDPTHQQRRFIPLLIEHCTIPDTIAQFKTIDWRDKEEKAYEELLDACRYEEKAIAKGPVGEETAVKEPVILEGHDKEVGNVAIRADGKSIFWPFFGLSLSPLSLSPKLTNLHAPRTF